MDLTSTLAGTLVDLALSGRGWQALLDQVMSATGRQVRLIGVHGRCVCAAPAGAPSGVEPSTVAGFDDAAEPRPITCLDGWQGTAVVLRAGNRRVGLLALEGQLTDDGRMALEAARVPVCIEAVRRDADAAARAESASRVIDEVRFGLLRDPVEVSRFAERFGINFDRPHAGVVFSYRGANQRTWQTALTWVEMPIRQEGTEGWTVLPAVEQELPRIRTRLQGMVGDDVPVVAASGSVVANLADTPRSFAEAEATLAVLRRRPPHNQLCFAELGLLGLLLSVPRDRLAGFVDAGLAPLLARPDLLVTLVAWLETNGSRAAVASSLDIHRNSVGYRIAKIQDLLGIDLDDSAAALQVRSALTAREALAVLDAMQQGESGRAVHPRLD